jgi:hypothetical protein
MARKPQKRKSPATPGRKPSLFWLFLRELLGGLKRNRGGLLLAAVLIQLMTFLVLMASFINFHTDDDMVFGKQTTSKPIGADKPADETKEKGLPLFHSSVYAAYAIACLGGTLLFRRAVARRSFRILVYLQTPGLVFTLYAIGRLLWRNQGHQ